MSHIEQLEADEMYYRAMDRNLELMRIRLNNIGRLADYQPMSEAAA
jgi:hypothetical protein